MAAKINEPKNPPGAASDLGHRKLSWSLSIAGGCDVRVVQADHDQLQARVKHMSRPDVSIAAFSETEARPPNSSLWIDMGLVGL